ncbi:uncharacterized protein V3H82_003168 [Fundulus diaphanus]
MRDYVNEQPQHTEKKLSERRLYHVLFFSIGLLCIIQAVLNLSLRLTLYSSKTAVTSGCNVTDIGGENHRKEGETDCEQIQPGHCKTFLEDICALKKDRSQLENSNSELRQQMKEVEEERDILKRKLAANEQLYMLKSQCLISQCLFLLSELNGCVSSQWCPADWRRLNSRCYFLSTEMQTWEGSRKHCQSQGADLVVINSEQEQEAIYRLNGSENLLFWIGLHGKDGTFQWVDGSALEKSFWQSGQPDHGGPNNKEDCVEMYHKEPVLGSWNDAPCGHQRHWLCEKDLGFLP